MTAAIPVPADVTTSSESLGGIPVVNVETADADPERIIFYLHGGAYAIETAALSVGLASDLSRRAGTRLVTVDYRLAPEHPQPAAIEDAIAAYRGLLDSGVSTSSIAVAGESAGAGLAAALLVALKHERSRLGGTDVEHSSGQVPQPVKYVRGVGARGRYRRSSASSPPRRNSITWSRIASASSWEISSPEPSWRRSRTALKAAVTEAAIRRGRTSSGPTSPRS